MDTILGGKVAIVTGAGGGLERSHALYLPEKGVRIVVNNVSAEAAERDVVEVETRGGTAMAAAASVTDDTAIEAMVASVLAA